MSAEQDYFDRAVAAGHGMLTLALAGGPGSGVLSDREQRLVQAAIESGVLGAMAVAKEDAGETGQER